MKATIKDGKLHVEIALFDPPVRSASGKTLVVASTRGNKRTEVTVEGKVKNQPPDLTAGEFNRRE